MGFISILLLLIPTVSVVGSLQLKCSNESTTTKHCFQDFPTPLYNKYLGPQLDSSLSVLNTTSMTNATFTTFPLFTVSYKHVCDKQIYPSMNNKIVLLQNNPLYFFQLKLERGLMECVAEAGGVAVVLIYNDLKVPGFGYLVDRHVHSSLKIPVLHGVQSDFGSLIDLLESSTDQNVMWASLSVDDNKWIEMFESQTFLWLWRIILPITNFFGALVNIWALTIHALRSRTHGLSHTNPYMVLGNIVELAACLVRAVYCAVGPMFSTSSVDYNAHTFLLNVTISMEFATSFIAAILFLRWGAFGRVRRQRLVQRSLIFCTMGSVPAQLALAVLQILPVAPMPVLLAVNACTAFVMGVVSGIIFIHTGSRFVKQLGTTKGVGQLPSKRKRSLRKATQWIMISAAMQVFICIGSVTAVVPSFFFTPWGWFVTFTLMYCGATGQAITQSLSFKPFEPNAAQKLVNASSSALRKTSNVIATQSRRYSNTLGRRSGSQGTITPVVLTAPYMHSTNTLTSGTPQASSRSGAYSDQVSNASPQPARHSTGNQKQQQQKQQQQQQQQQQQAPTECDSMSISSRTLSRALPVDAETSQFAIARMDSIRRKNSKLDAFKRDSLCSSHSSTCEAPNTLLPAGETQHENSSGCEPQTKESMLLVEPSSNRNRTEETAVADSNTVDPMDAHENAPPDLLQPATPPRVSSPHISLQIFVQQPTRTFTAASDVE